MKYILLLVVLCINIKGYSQNAYYDALFLASLNEADLNVSNALQLGITDGEKEVINELRVFHANPFIAPKIPDFARARLVFNKIRLNALGAQQNEGLIGTAIPSLVSNLLSFSNLSTAQVDTILYGLTIRISEEFRRNYMESYLRVFGKTIDNVGELKALFPVSYQKLQSFDPIRYKDLGNEMKRTFDQDLSVFPDNLIRHITSQESNDFKNCKILSAPNCWVIRNAPAFPYLVLSTKVGQKLVQGVHPGDIISYMDEACYTNPTFTLSNSGSSIVFDRNFTNTIHLINIIQRNLRDTSGIRKEGTNVWINFEDLAKLNTPQKQAYFVSLLYHEDPDFFRTILSGFNGTLFKDFTDIKTYFSDRSRREAYSKLFVQFKNEKLIRLISALVQIDEYVKLNGKSLMEEAKFIPFMRLTTEVIKIAIPTNGDNIEKLTEIINEAFIMYNEIRVKNYSNFPAHFKTLFTYMNERHAIGLDLEKLSQNIDNVTAFSSAVISANTSEEINQVIKHFADPPSSYIHKRNQRFTWSIGAMPGLILGWEKFDQKQIANSVIATNIDKNNNNRFVTGLTLPIGFDFSFGIFKKQSIFKNPASVSIFAQAIDLGAMLNYRLSTNSNVLPDKITLEQVFSPGLSLGFGWPNSPITISFGYQYAPKLRGFNTVKTTDPATSTEKTTELSVVDTRYNANRWSFRFAYDIPLFRLARFK